MQARHAAGSHEKSSCLPGLAPPRKEVSRVSRGLGLGFYRVWPARLLHARLHTVLPVCVTVRPSTNTCMHANKHALMLFIGHGAYIRELRHMHTEIGTGSNKARNMLRGKNDEQGTTCQSWAKNARVSPRADSLQ